MLSAKNAAKLIKKTRKGEGLIRIRPVGITMMSIDQVMASSARCGTSSEVQRRENCAVIAVASAQGGVRRDRHSALKEVIEPRQGEVGGPGAAEHPAALIRLGELRLDASHRPVRGCGVEVAYGDDSLIFVFRQRAREGRK